VMNMDIVPVNLESTRIKRVIILGTLSLLDY
jgi:hypothetical protein